MNRLSTVLLCALFMLPLHMAHGIPAKGVLLRHVQPDGTEISYYLNGDEHYHTYLSTDGKTLVLNPEGWMVEASEAEVAKRKAGIAARPRKSLACDENGMSTFPTVGKLKGLVILAEFSDNSFYEEHTNAMYQDFMNGDNFTFSGATGSVRDYFLKQSSGKFDPDFDVVGPVKLPHDISYYGENVGSYGDYNAYKMIVDATDILDEQTDIDFSQYDNDGDGNVDFVYVIYAGYGEAFGAPDWTIWPHQDMLNNHGGGRKHDGVYVDRYACSCELINAEGHVLNGIGTFCHEFGHVLGLPDLYPTAGDLISFLGYWDVMDTGCYNNDLRTPANYSAYERYLLHWLELDDLTTHEASISLPSLSSSNKAFRIRTDSVNEVFILENRQNDDYDAALPGSGLLVTQIDVNSYLWQQNSVNNDMNHPYWRIIPADNSTQNNQSGDAFPGPDGQSSFTPYSTPAAVQWDGNPLAGGLTNIHIDEDGNAVFNFLTHRLSGPVLTKVTGTNDTFSVEWRDEPGANGYETQLLPSDDNDERRVLLDETFDKMLEGTYGSAMTDDLAEQLDEYTSTGGWTGSNLYSAGGMVLLGGYGVTGTLNTPVVDLTGKTGEVTIGMRMKAHNGRSVTCYVRAYNSETGEELAKVKVKATSTNDNYVANFTNLPAKVYFSLSTSQERCYLDEMKVVYGTFTTDDVWDASDVIATHTGITACSDTFTNISQNKTYKVLVRSMANDRFYDSDWTIGYVTLTSDGIVTDINGADIEHDIAVASAEPVAEMIQQGTEETFHVVVKNMAPTMVKDPVLSYSVQDGKITGKMKVEATLGYREEAAVDVTIPLNDIDDEGDIETTFSTDFSDGTADERPDDNSLTAVTTIVNDKYLQHMTVEEGTGTWCVYCPLGIVGMRTMNEKYPKRFLGIAIHGGSTDPYINSVYEGYIDGLVDGYPECVIDRNPKLYDPSKEVFEEYISKLEEYSNVGIGLKASYEDGKLTFNADVRFLHDVDNVDYKIAYVVLEDSLYSSQRNGYAGSGIEMGGFENMSNPTNVYLDDVARGIFPDPWGEYLFSGAVDHRQGYTHSLTVTMPTHNDKENLSVCALVFDKDGTIVNSIRIREIEGINASGISNVALSTNNDIYNLAGQRVNVPVKGINIIGGRKYIVR